MSSLSNWFNEFPMKLLKAGGGHWVPPGEPGLLLGVAARLRVELAAALRHNVQLPIRIITRVENFSQHPKIWVAYYLQKGTINRMGGDKCTTITAIWMLQKRQIINILTVHCMKAMLSPVKKFSVRQEKCFFFFLLLLLFLLLMLMFSFFFFLLHRHADQRANV